MASLLTGPAERWDVIVDFTGLAGQRVILYNDAPAPFPMGRPAQRLLPGNPNNPTQPTPGFGPNTRQIMAFDVGTRSGAAGPARWGSTPDTDLTRRHRPDCWDLSLDDTGSVAPRRGQGPAVDAQRVL